MTRKARKILFVTEHFYPDISATGNCIRILSDYFWSKKWDVTVLSKQTNIKWKDEEVIDQIKIHRIKPLFYEMETDKRTKKLLFKIIYRFASIILLPIWPIKSLTTSNRFYKKIIKLNKQNHYDAIVYSVNPPSSLIINFKVKKHSKIQCPTAVYYLDALQGVCTNKLFGRKISDKKIKKLEQKCLPYFDKVLFSKGHEEIYNKEINNSQNIFLGLPTLSINKLNAKVKHKNGRKKNISMVYAGTISKERNPNILINVLAELANQYHTKIRLDLYGKLIDVKMPRHKDIFFECVHNGQIEARQIDKIYNQSDVLVNIDNINQNMIPSKIFEYISYKKPIINFSQSNNSKVSKLLEKYNYALTINTSKELTKKQREIIVNFINNSSNISIDAKEILRNFNDYTPIRFYEIICNMIEDKKK